MILPNEINILGHKYKIVQVDDMENLGTCNTNDCIITLNMSQSDSQLLDTLLHEIIEAFNIHLEMKLKHRNIQALGACFHQVFNENPEIVKLFA